MELVDGSHVMTSIIVIVLFLIEVCVLFLNLIIFLTLFIVQSPHRCSPTPLKPSYYFPPWHWYISAATAHWKKMPVSNEPPPPRAYHTMTRIGSRFLLIGGYDGKSTFSDMWWLVSEGLFSLLSSAFGILTWNFESSSFNSLLWDQVDHRLELKPTVHFFGSLCYFFMLYLQLQLFGSLAEDPIAKRAVLSPANSFKNASPAGARTSPGQSPSGDSKV